VLLANRPAPQVAPRLRDMAPTLLKLYGVETPKAMTGQPLW
jgi:bisphosphoglycerate-independent phosphoglycerate mutase (AlkP superfamily)